LNYHLQSYSRDELVEPNRMAIGGIKTCTYKLEILALFISIKVQIIKNKARSILPQKDK
ncbi:hypothetical protein ACJX0J_024953, partial [Zea mays]